MKTPAIDRWARISRLLPQDAFSRQDEGDDHIFYTKPRMVPHLDSRALATVERVIGNLIVEPRPVILDLMASFDSHILASVEAATVVGLGLNMTELESNPALDERVVHDLNADPTLPFEDGRFDVVLNTVSVDYLVGGWDAMSRQGNHGFSYRLMYDPLRDVCRPTPVASPWAQAKHVIAPRG